jgi:pyruvate/2-oxoglutarate dehydrogenase complex dihydrolipoamide dehydrogenase (E3) component
MLIEVVREKYLDNATIGKMFVDGVFFAFTLEDKVREIKVWGETAIPTGTYSVFVRYSNRFKKELVAIKDVPNFDGVLIHGGNTDKDTHGCILIGEMRDLKAGTIYKCGDVVNKITDLVRKNPNSTIVVR